MGASHGDAVVGGEKRRRQSIVGGAQVENTMDGREDRACDGQPAAAEFNHLTVNTIFLIRECVKGESGGKELGRCVKEQAEAMVANEQLDVR